MSSEIRQDASEGFDAADEARYYAEAEVDGFFDRPFEDDGQPTEHEEWQDLYGGDEMFDRNDWEPDYCMDFCDEP